MSVLIDTTVLSLGLRRRDPSRLSDHERQVVEEFVRLSERGEAVLLGIVRQELLSGVRHREQFDRLRWILDGYDYLAVELPDHDAAAEYTNRCRAAGIDAGDIDMLICAAAVRAGAAILTTDGDFRHYARRVPITLHHV